MKLSNETEIKRTLMQQRETFSQRKRERETLSQRERRNERERGGEEVVDE